MKEVLCEELKAFAVTYGFEVLDCRILFPPQIDDFVMSSRIAVSLVVSRYEKKYIFGGHEDIHPAISLDQFMSQVRLCVILYLIQ